MAALLTGIGSELHVDKRGGFRGDSLLERGGILVGSCDIVSLGSEGFGQLVVTSVDVECGRCGIGSLVEGFAYSVVNTSVVEDTYRNGKFVAADGREIHSREAESGISFDSHDALAGSNRGSDGGIWRCDLYLIIYMLITDES